LFCTAGTSNFLSTVREHRLISVSGVGGPLFNGDMTSTATLLDQLEQLLQSSEICHELDEQFDAASPTELIEVVVRAGAVQRRLNAVITTATGRILDRDLQPREARVSEKAGCRDATELLRRALRTDTAAAPLRRRCAGDAPRDGAVLGRCAARAIRAARPRAA